MKRFSKLSVSLLLILAIILSAIPAFAEQSVPTISPWAVLGVNDGQMMGLVSLGADSLTRNYRAEITMDEIKDLNDKLVEKLESQNLKKNVSFKEVKVEENPTRETVLLNIYNILGKYDKDVNENTNPIEYLAKNNILKGKGSGFDLDHKATLEEGILFYTRAVTDLYDDHDLGGKGVFYKVKNKGNTVYLLGSIHLGDFSMYPIEAERIEAFNEADELYVEINLLDPAVLEETQKYQVKTDGKTIKDELGDELYARLKAVLDKYGISEDVYKYSEGWAIYNTLNFLPLLESNPYATSIGVDMYFLTNALVEGKPINSLENVETQMKTLKEFYGEGNDKLKNNIDEVLTAIEKNETNVIVDEYKGLIDSWKNGDVKKFATMFDEDEESKALVVSRDPDMAKKIKELLDADGEKTYMVLVGAGHYAPKDSIIKYLKDYGFTVEDLNN